MTPLPPEEIEVIASEVGLPAETVREIEARLLRRVHEQIEGGAQ